MRESVEVVEVEQVVEQVVVVVVVVVEVVEAVQVVEEVMAVVMAEEAEEMTTDCSSTVASSRAPAWSAHIRYPYHTRTAHSALCSLLASALS